MIKYNLFYFSKFYAISFYTARNAKCFFLLSIQFFLFVCFYFSGCVYLCVSLCGYTYVGRCLRKPEALNLEQVLGIYELPHLGALNGTQVLLQGHYVQWLH